MSVSGGVAVIKVSAAGVHAVVMLDAPLYGVIAGSPARDTRTRLRWQSPSRIDPGHEEDVPYLLSALRRTKPGLPLVEPTASSPLLAALAAPPFGGHATLSWCSASLGYSGPKRMAKASWFWNSPSFGSMREWSFTLCDRWPTAHPMPVSTFCPSP